MADADAAKAYDALCRLAVHPETVELVAKQLKPATAEPIVLLAADRLGQPMENRSMWIIVGKVSLWEFGFEICFGFQYSDFEFIRFAASAFIAQNNCKERTWANNVDYLG